MADHSAPDGPSGDAAVGATGVILDVTNVGTGTAAEGCRDIEVTGSAPGFAVLSAYICPEILQGNMFIQIRSDQQVLHCLVRVEFMFMENTNAFDSDTAFVYSPTFLNDDGASDDTCLLPGGIGWATSDGSDLERVTGIQVTGFGSYEASTFHPLQGFTVLGAEFTDHTTAGWRAMTISVRNDTQDFLILALYSHAYLLDEAGRPVVRLLLDPSDDAIAEPGTVGILNEVFSRDWYVGEPRRLMVMVNGHY